MASGNRSQGKPHQQRADILVRELERFIREGRSGKRGMRFSTWQAMARKTIDEAFAAIEKEREAERRSGNRAVAWTIFSAVTIGFWGAVYVVAESFGDLAAVLAGLAVVLLFVAAGERLLRGFMGDFAAMRRAEGLARIESLDKKVKRLEYELNRKRKSLEEEAEEDASG